MYVCMYVCHCLPCQISGFEQVLNHPKHAIQNHPRIESNSRRIFGSSHRRRFSKSTQSRPCSLCTIVCALMRCLTRINQFAHKEKLTEQERKECLSNMPPLCPPPSPASPRLTRVAKRWCLFALSRLSLHPPSPASLVGVVCYHVNAPPFPIFGNRSLKSNIATSWVVNSNVLQDVYRRW